MANNVVTGLIVEFLEQISEEDGFELNDEIKELVAAAVAHGAYRALDVVFNKYENPEGKVESVSMVDILEEAAEILSTIFDSDEDEDEDADEEGDEKTLLEVGTVEPIGVLSHAHPIESVDLSLVEAQKDIDTQLDTDGVRPIGNWVTLERLSKGKKAN